MTAITGPAPAYRNDIHDSPWVTLSYLFFVFLPLLFWSPPLAAVLVSGVAAAVFVPLHFRFYRTGPRHRAVLVFVVAAIGYAVIPFNPGGNTFLVYAGAMAGMTFQARTAIAVTAGLLAIMALEFWLTMPNLQLALGWSAIVTVIASMVLAGTLFSRVKARRDAELRLTRDEVGRLAAMAERERIGRDLHDLLGHTLSLVAIKSELAGRLVDRDPVAAKRQIGEVEAVARQALAQVREAVIGIRATGLQAELAAARLALLSAEIGLDQRLAPVALSPEVESALAMVLREAVTNILRHASAHQVDVELVQDGGELRLAIGDDGCGGIAKPGNGLSGMRERIAALGGRLDIDSPAGGGTRLLIALPRTALTGSRP